MDNVIKIKTTRHLQKDDFLDVLISSTIQGLKPLDKILLIEIMKEAPNVYGYEMKRRIMSKPPFNEKAAAENAISRIVVSLCNKYYMNEPVLKKTKVKGEYKLNSKLEQHVLRLGKQPVTHIIQELIYNPHVI